MSKSSRSYRPMAQVRAVGGPYVDQVVADFRALPGESREHARYAEASALADDSANLEWQQLFTLEQWVLQLMPLYQLEERAAVLGQIFAHPASARPQPPAGPDADASEAARQAHADARHDYHQRLLAWALNLQSERQWVFRKNLLREQEAWRLRRRLGETLLSVTVLALTIAWFAWLIDLPVLVMLVMVAWLGVGGAYASIARRSQAAGATRPGDTSRGTAFGNLCALDVGQGSVVQAMLLAGLFAMIGYGLLASGLFELVLDKDLVAAILPGFKPCPNAGSCSELPLPLPMPQAPADLAKLAVWSFLFGFTERLVPDVLDKVGGKLRGKTDKGSS